MVESGRKIVGSAQRRKNKVFFRHGSILMDRRITSENGERKKNREKIIDGLILGFEKRLGIKLVLGQLTKEKVKLSQGFM